MSGAHSTTADPAQTIAIGSAQSRQRRSGSRQVSSARRQLRTSAATATPPSSRVGRPMYQMTQYRVCSEYSRARVDRQPLRALQPRDESGHRRARMTAHRLHVRPDREDRQRCHRDEAADLGQPSQRDLGQARRHRPPYRGQPRQLPRDDRQGEQPHGRDPGDRHGPADRVQERPVQHIHPGEPVGRAEREPDEERDALRAPADQQQRGKRDRGQQVEQRVETQQQAEAER